MPQKCIVPQCGNRPYKLKGVPFFAFPKDTERRRQWVEAVGVQPSKITQNARVCGKHFETTDYYHFASVHRLKKGRRPTLCLPSTAPVTRPSLEGGTEDLNTSMAGTSRTVVSNQNTRGTTPKRYGKTYRYHSYQRRSQFLIENYMKSDAKINYYTGVQTFAILRALFRFVLKTESGPKGVVHQNKQTMASTGGPRTHKLSPFNELFLTLMKLQRGFDYETLADMFLLSRASVCRIFIAWVNLLYTKLGSLYMWPHRAVLLQNAPLQFLQQYPGVIGSIDCTEFNIEKPSSLVRQSQCYSHYKGTTTLKALIMIDPNGAIIFVSALFTGSISDKQILEDSGFCYVLRKKVELGELQQGDIILADKGFNVQDLIANIGLTLNITTFRLTGMQFSAQDVEYIRTIAHERIHVERAIRRLKAFTILSKRISVALLGSINQIYTVCALLCNFRFPLRK